MNNNKSNGPSRGGATRSWGSAQSVSTSGSVGSPSSKAEAVTTTPTVAGENTFLRLNHLDIHAVGDDAGSQDVGFVPLSN